MSTPSALVADRYRLVKLLGAGGMGVVWQAWDTRLRRPVALKMLRTQPELTDRERQVATDRAMREARNTAGLHHPHAVTVFDVVEHEGQPCIVMQLIESTPLSDLLRENGTMTTVETARVGAEVASALAAAHDLKIVHRDVKPGNILIAADGSAMISDFGISHALGDATITATGMIHGTPAYLAPEVARGLPTSFASDVFSLGSTLYAMLEGDPPFGTERNPITLLHKVARGGYPAPKHAGPLAAPLRKMLSSQPKRRPTMQSVAEMLAALQQGNSLPDLAGDLRTLGFGAAGVVAASSADADRAGDDAETPQTVAFDEATAATEALEDTPLEESAATAPTEALHDAAVEEVATPAATAASDEPSATAPTVALEDEPDAPATVGPARPDRDGADIPNAIFVPPRPPDPMPVPAPIGRTLPMDQPTRYQPPTAETEPLGRAARGDVGVPSPGRERPAEAATATAPRGRRRRVGIVAGVIAVVVAAVIAIVLSLDLQPDVAPRAEPTPEPTAVTTPDEESARPTQTAAPAPTPSPSAPPAVEPAPAPAPQVAPEQRVVDTITGYYAMLPGDRDAAWPLMTADYQVNHAGGRGGYEAFWSQVSEVSVSEVSASSPEQGQATVTYRFQDGRVVEEVTAYRFIDEGGVLKIAATEVLSSRGL
ncbi:MULTISPECIES: serine/threonine-protein kinase [Microbacterium]|uniref:serine/threonine-protein kinase n=1 Tax=Microbacterium TaxID=33882 RepID=UPI000D6515E9|nr:MULTISPECIES: serine/threonine-protein kinase [Microbacterium]